MIKQNKNNGFVKLSNAKVIQTQHENIAPCLIWLNSVLSIRRAGKMLLLLRLPAVSYRYLKKWSRYTELKSKVR